MIWRVANSAKPSSTPRGRARRFPWRRSSPRRRARAAFPGAPPPPESPPGWRRRREEASTRLPSPRRRLRDIGARVPGSGPGSCWRRPRRASTSARRNSARRRSRRRRRHSPRDSRRARRSFLLGFADWRRGRRLAATPSSTRRRIRWLRNPRGDTSASNRASGSDPRVSVLTFSPFRPSPRRARAIVATRWSRWRSGVEGSSANAPPLENAWYLSCVGTARVNSLTCAPRRRRRFSTRSSRSRAATPPSPPRFSPPSSTPRSRLTTRSNAVTGEATAENERSPMSRRRRTVPSTTAFETRSPPGLFVVMFAPPSPRFSPRRLPTRHSRRGR